MGAAVEVQCTMPLSRMALYLLLGAAVCCNATGLHGSVSEYPYVMISNAACT